MRKTLTKKLKFWGTRGSCPVSGKEYQKFGGNTLCLEICYEKTHIILDAGTGIRPLGEAISSSHKGPIQLFLSHTHWDHIHGFPFFKPLNDPGQHITIFSPRGLGRSTEELFEELLASEFSPLSFDKVKNRLKFQTIQQGHPIQLGPITLDFHPTCHSGVALGFKIKTPHQTIGYVTDNEALYGHLGEIDQIPPGILKKDQSFIHFLSDCDLLVHEAQYSSQEYAKKIGWGHSSISNTIALIKETKIKNWLVTHHDPKHTDDDLKQAEQKAQDILKQHKIPCLAEWIGDGFVLDLK
jgi:ribonuclease BN (tRNA processing enzyme)